MARGKIADSERRASIGSRRGRVSGTEPPDDGGGILGKLEHAAGGVGGFVGNLARDIGETAVGIPQGVKTVGEAIASDVAETIRDPWVTGAEKEALLEQWRHPLRPVAEGAPHAKSAALGQAVVGDYIRRYGPLAHGDVGKVVREAYEHPLAPALDILTVGSAGAAAKALRAGRYGERGTIVTRSPRAIATGVGPRATELTSASPWVRMREEALAKHRARRPEGVKVKLPGVREPVRLGGGEMRHYGKGIQKEATQHALENVTSHAPYVKATKGLSDDEWGALHVRALDIHPDDLAGLWKGTPNEGWINDSKVRALALKPSPKLLHAEREARRLSETGAGLLRQRGGLGKESEILRPELPKRHASEELGRPVRSITGKPYYFPHTFEETRAPVSPLTVTGGGKGVPTKLGTQKRNVGALLLSGKIHLRGDVLGPEFLRRVKAVKYDEIHNALVRGAVQLRREDIEKLPGGRLPKGWEYVRTHHRERVPPAMRGTSEEHVPLSELVPDPGDLQESQLAREGFATADPMEAHRPGEHYHIIPTSMTKAATGEFTRSNDFVHNFVKKPLAVWRALILGLRPGFLTNNIVGSSAMYAVRTGGQGAFRDLFRSIVEQHGPRTAKRIADHPSTPPDLRKSLYDEFFPEQRAGTFGGTQSPATGRRVTPAGRALGVGRAVTGALPHASGVYEAGTRRALIRNLIRNSPEFRGVYKAMPRQTRTFETAARKLLEDPKTGVGYQRRISKEVNDALGSYMGLGPTERNVLRNAAPFYAWYKAITTATLHLAADTPLRANALGHLGQIGKEQSEEALGEMVPSWLRGSIPLGEGPGGTTRVLATQPANPWSTLEQLRRGTVEDVTDLGLNPFIVGAAEAYARAKEGQRGGREGGLGPLQIAGTTLKEMGRTLPPVRLAFPQAPSRLYPNRSRRSELLGYLGAPVKEYAPGEAMRQWWMGR